MQNKAKNIRIDNTLENWKAKNCKNGNRKNTELQNIRLCCILQIHTECWKKHNSLCDSRGLLFNLVRNKSRDSTAFSLISRKLLQICGPQENMAKLVDLVVFNFSKLVLECLVAYLWWISLKVLAKCKLSFTLYINQKIWWILIWQTLKTFISRINV